jgi:hypothetical protein
MITFNTPRLLEKGISTAYMELDPDTSKVSSSIKETLERYHCSPGDAQPFIVTIYAYDINNRQVMMGMAECVYHKKLAALALGEDYRSCRQLLYLNMLFIESEYEKCGIATSVLEHITELIDAEMGSSIGAIILSPVPQYRNSDGRIVQLPFGTEFFIKYLKLIDFYAKRDFSFCQSRSLMGKRIA